jgi:NDP-sugar pyrophosphorylase family protein
MQIVILAGGRGSRMGALTQKTQKCQLDVDGKPVLMHILDNIIEAFGCVHVTVALGYRGESIVDYYGDRYKQLSLTYICNPNPLETRKRLLLAKDLIDSPFLFLAGDVICHPEQMRNVVALQQNAGEFVLGTMSVATCHSPARSHGLVSIKNGRVVDLVFPPTSEWHENQYRDMQVACYAPEFLQLLHDAPDNCLYISPVICSCIERGKVFQASVYNASWYHIAEPKDLSIKISYE